ncbi:probable G-protein coupled receptor 141 isoform X7 [Camelus ferus]|uniref:Probable G-protein coupled receptor 141 isoform X7 n=1 Tax=Camelus ferus TaxID=419612 RepID=A0A8B8TBH9_CAMFR|nr:probable G-protein coupled receptor 141 isoform X7 [Camelus ferus]
MQPVPVLFKAEIKHFNSKSSCQERKDNCWKVAGETPQIPTLALLEEAKAVAMHSLQIGKGDSTHVFSPRVFCCFCCRLSPYHPAPSPTQTHGDCRPINMTYNILHSHSALQHSGPIC